MDYRLRDVGPEPLALAAARAPVQRPRKAATEAPAGLAGAPILPQSEEAHYEPTSDAQKGAQDGGDDEEYLPPPILRLSKNLASLLRHRASDEGLNVRTDGFAKLDEVLSLNCMQFVLEHVSPGGRTPEVLLRLIREMVSTSHSKGRPRFELWEGTGTDGGTEVWIRAMHKHSLAHVAVPGGTPAEDPASENAKEEGCSAKATEEEEEPEPSLDRVSNRNAPAQEPAVSNGMQWKQTLGDDRQCRPSSGEALPVGAGRRAAPRSQQRPMRALLGPCLATLPANMAAESPAMGKAEAALPKDQGSPLAPGVATEADLDAQHRIAFREILGILPMDAPAGVRAYLESLARRGG